MVANPFAEGGAADQNASGVGSGRLAGLLTGGGQTPHKNVYYRKCRIANLM